MKFLEFSVIFFFRTDFYAVEVEVGHCPRTHFDKVGRENLCKNFNRAIEIMYPKPQLKNKWDALKTDWKIWNDLIGKETGLEWNSKKKTVDASDEWWLKYPQASKFCKEGIALEIEEKFDRMFMNTTAIGDYVRINYAWTPASGFVPSESGKMSTDNVSLIESSGATWKIINKMDEREEKKKAKVGGAAMLSEQINRLVDAVESCKSSETSSACNKTPEFTITQCIGVLKDIYGLDKPLYFFFLQLIYFVRKRREKCLWPWMKLMSLVGSSMSTHMQDRN
ncbi:hypothetical protein UlMin_043599 [Ulmus minor]